MPRPKGFKLSEEQKAKMKEGRLASRQVKEKKIPVKAELVLTGEEKDAFDILPKLRYTMRKAGMYTYLHKAEYAITRLEVWQDIKAIKSILEEYVCIKNHT